MPHTPCGQLHWTEATCDTATQTVVLLHGLGGDAGFWANEQQALARHFRVLALDMRGSGRSAACSGPLSIEDLAADVVTVLDAAGVESAHVVGFSMGGLVAQALAVTFPQRVSRLVLAATFATTNVQARHFLKAVASVYRNDASARLMYDLIVPWLFSLPFLSDERAAPFLSYPEDGADDQSREDWLCLLDADLAFDGRDRLASIRTPTLVLAGADDALAPPSDAEQLARGIEGAVLRVIPGGHLFNIESADAFERELLGFFQAHTD
ncbi:alpha/beta fold hydrolase [Pseudomonas sp. C1C7]|uniref:alpha/beta fold hydrolase n=1 Tax=Pseudomonas sp. C1C7 TaxID=2735272 RepID=UPI001585FB9A|nr:alpha/beta hydrolase [Pseudomonas sp. C1C7]NUT77795.1 alpha/beta fold hydrolase [Pseudomonas sp. C1C7]